MHGGAVMTTLSLDNTQNSLLVQFDFESVNIITIGFGASIEDEIYHFVDKETGVIAPMEQRQHDYCVQRRTFGFEPNVFEGAKALKYRGFAPGIYKGAIFKVATIVSYAVDFKPRIRKGFVCSYHEILPKIREQISGTVAGRVTLGEGAIQ